jgi:hypothetical protein
MKPRRSESMRQRKDRFQEFQRGGEIFRSNPSRLRLARISGSGDNRAAFGGLS